MKESQQRVCYCGVPERLFGRGGRLLKWEKRHLLWMIVDYIPTLEKAAQTKVYFAAFRGWSNVCGLTFGQTFEQGEADFLILTRPLDGPGGTLAEHQLPYGDDAQLWGRFDIGDDWSVSPTLPATKISLLSVATHEFGHGIGLPHISTPNSLMNAFYDPAIISPQAADIAEAVRRYGPPKEKNAPLLPPAGDYPTKITIEMASGAEYPVLVPANGKWGGG